MSDITKQLKKKAIIYQVISIAIWVSVAIFAIISSFLKAKGLLTKVATGVELKGEVKSALVGLGITMLIAVVVAMFISNKLRTTIYMLSVIASTICYGQVAMYIIFALWLVDEYVLVYLAKKYKTRYDTNKEIDLRTEV